MTVDHGAVRDPFTTLRADRLGFLGTPAQVPGGPLPVLRGAARVFEAGHRAGANEAATAAAIGRDAAAVSPVSEVASVPDAVAGNVALGLDLSSLTPDQLMQLMMACAAQMMARMNQAAATFSP